MRYWLFKSEPDVYSLADLRKDKRTAWEGVRNYQARNLLRDEVREGDGVLFYHSRVEPMAVAGTAKVVKAGYPDPSQFDPKSPYHDPAATRDSPRWFAVDIAFAEEFARPVALKELRATAGLEDMALLRRGSRLSIQPVTADEWRIIRKLGAKRTS